MADSKRKMYRVKAKKRKMRENQRPADRQKRRLPGKQSSAKHEQS
jgi:hypothetical protein